MVFAGKLGRQTAAGHKTTSNLGDRGMDSKQSYFIFQETGLLVPAESRWKNLEIEMTF